MSVTEPRIRQEEKMVETKTITAERPSLFAFLNPLAMFVNLWQMRGLIGQMTRRDVVATYKGTYLGVIWQIATPLMMLAVYTLAFGVIMNVTFSPQPLAGELDVSLNLFCGLIVYNGVFAGTVGRASGLILAYRNYVKRVIFPLEILPVAILGSSLVNAAMSLAILLLALLVFLPKFSSTAFLFPVVLIPLCFLTLGISWFLASLGVFLRDIGQSVGIILQLMFFLSPVFYPVSVVPQDYQFIFRWNPLTFIIEDTRRTLILGEWPDWLSWVVVTAISLVVLQFGYAWFMRSKRAFADVV